MKGASSKARAGALFFVVIVCAVMVLSNLSVAQTKSQVTGKVTDATTGRYLPGANVYLKDTSFGAASDLGGTYVLYNVPPGNYTLVCSYIGYDEMTAQIAVSGDGRVIRRDIQLTSSYVAGEVVTVYGLREGQMKALSQQRTASNIKNVVDEEQMQRFPDVNSAEVLQRVSGVSVTRDQGEGRYVLVRGTAARLNNMTLNGEKIPSPEGDVRNVALDVIAADQLASIEVTKAITPDMDGNAIGGSVNLRTKSALDYPARVFNVTTVGGYNNLMGKGGYQGGLTYGDRFGANKNLGLMISGSYQRSNRGSDNNEMEWGSEDDTSGVEIPFALRNLETRSYEFQRNRMTFSGTMDYLLSEGHKMYVTGLFSKYKDSEHRRRLAVLPEDGLYTTATSIIQDPEDTAPLFEAQLRQRDQNQMIYNIAAGGEHQFDKAKLDYRFSYSYAEEKEAKHIEANFELDEEPELTLDLSDTDTPQWTTNLGAGYEYDPEHFVLDDIEWHDNLTSDRDVTGAFNLEIPYMLGTNQASFKLGGKAVMKKKDRNENIWEYGWEGEDDKLMSEFPSDFEHEDFLNGEYPLPPFADSDLMWEFFDANKDGLLEGELNREDTDGGRYEAS